MRDEVMIEKYMKMALELAKKAASLGEVPVGAIVVKDDKIIGSGYNTREQDNDVTSHAEIIAIKEAAAKIGDWRLGGCSIYVTLEPCPMCAGAIINARIDEVIFGCFDQKAGACGSVANLFHMPFGHSPKIRHSVLESECAEILQEFFKKKRKKEQA